MTPKQIAEGVQEFLKSELGEHFLMSLATEYNDLHHEAERSEASLEYKALKVERAAGVKWAIDWLVTRRDQLIDKQNPE